jgi:hypothetical protein
MSEKSSFGGTSLDNQFVGENPSKNARISYFLPKRHTFGKMTAEVLDKEGKVIAKLEAGKQKGVNTIEWGFNSKAPKVAKGKTMAFQALFAPRVTAGTYSIQITKGNEVFKKEIDVIYDPNSMFTAEERSQQQKVTKELFDFTQELAHLVYCIDQWDESLEGYLKVNCSADKKLVALNTALDNLRSELVVTKGDNYVGAGEPQLRERLGDLYSTVGSYFGSPSTTQLDNMKKIKVQFETAKNTYAALLNKELANFVKQLEKDSKGTKPVVLSLEDFLKKED